MQHKQKCYIVSWVRTLFYSSGWLDNSLGSRGCPQTHGSLPVSVSWVVLGIEVWTSDAWLSKQVHSSLVSYDKVFFSFVFLNLQTLNTIGLERSLSSCEHLLFFHRIQLGVPAPTLGLQPPCNLSSVGRIRYLTVLYGHLHTGGIHTDICIKIFNKCNGWKRPLKVLLVKCTYTLTLFINLEFSEICLIYKQLLSL